MNESFFQNTTKRFIHVHEKKRNEGKNKLSSSEPIIRQ